MPDQARGPEDASLAEGLFHLGWALWRSGRAREAEQVLRRARRIAEAAPEPRDALFGDICTNLALVLTDSGGDEQGDDRDRQR